MHLVMSYLFLFILSWVTYAGLPGAVAAWGRAFGEPGFGLLAWFGPCGMLVRAIVDRRLVNLMGCVGLVPGFVAQLQLLVRPASGSSRSFLAQFAWLGDHECLWLRL
jgi:hypothetical protein